MSIASTSSITRRWFAGWCFRPCLPSRSGAGGQAPCGGVATGGTIAGRGRICRQQRDHAAAAKVPVDKLLAGLPELANVAKVSGRAGVPDRLGKLHQRPSAQVGQRVSALAKQADVDGIVITHGTDTMEETAYFLNLTVHTNKPIVLVAPCAPARPLSADGALNLYSAVSVAASKTPQARACWSP